MDRQYEEQLVILCASENLDVDRWAAYGPRFFMAGLAVMMASASDVRRHAFLDLAELLHPGSSTPAVFSQWLAATPIEPSRFFPLVAATQE
jgi:hypothetical protein